MTLTEETTAKAEEPQVHLIPSRYLSIFIFEKESKEAQHPLEFGLNQLKPQLERNQPNSVSIFCNILVQVSFQGQLHV